MSHDSVHPTVSPCFVISSQFLLSPNIQVGHRPQQVDLCTAGGGAVQCTAGTVYSWYSVQCTVYSRWPCTVWRGGAAVASVHGGRWHRPNLHTATIDPALPAPAVAGHQDDHLAGPVLGTHPPFRVCARQPGCPERCRGAVGDGLTDLCSYIRLERTTLLLLAETVTVPPAVF